MDEMSSADARVGARRDGQTNPLEKLILGTERNGDGDGDAMPKTHKVGPPARTLLFEQQQKERPMFFLPRRRPGERPRVAPVGVLGENLTSS